MCFAPLLNVLRPLNQILAHHHFSSFFIFSFLDFLILTCEMLARSLSGWVIDLIFFGWPMVISVPTVWFCCRWPAFSWSPEFVWFLLKFEKVIFYVCQMWRGVITMSSFDPKSSFIKTYRISAFQRTFDHAHSPASCRDILVWISKSPFTFTFPERFHFRKRWL